MTRTNSPRPSSTNQPLLALELSHEMLDHIAPLLRGVAKHDRSLADPLRRAAQGVTLNLAESAAHPGGHRRRRNETALGSAYETGACLRIARSWGYVAGDATGHALAIVDGVAAMTYRLLRPRQCPRRSRGRLPDGLVINLRGSPRARLGHEGSRPAPRDGGGRGVRGARIPYCPRPRLTGEDCESLTGVMMMVARGERANASKPVIISCCT